MSLIGEQILLRVYLQSADRAPLTPTYQRLIQAARGHGLAGGTVLRGFHGFSERGVLHSSALGLVEHVPVIVELVDAAPRIGPFVNGPLYDLLPHGLVTLERAAVMMYRHRHTESSAPALLQLPPPLPPLSTLPAIESRPHMTRDPNGVLLRVFIGDSDRFGHQPLHQAILEKARALGLAGATVLRGSEGFGAHSVVHKAELLAMSSDLPLVIEIVDNKAKIDLLLPDLQAMVQEGMITMEQVLVLKYQAG